MERVNYSMGFFQPHGTARTEQFVAITVERELVEGDNFCMGVWKKTGIKKYKLNHFAWLANDAANAPSGIGNPCWPTRFFEEITLSP